MARVYSEISKFKLVEYKLRETANGYRNVISEINKALDGKRTKKEIVILQSVRQKCLEIHKQSVDVLMDFIDEVEKDAVGK